jgi:beta-carotene hydroxylase
VLYFYIISQITKSKMETTKRAGRGPIPTPIVSQPPHIPLIRDPADFPAIAWPTVFLFTVTFSSLLLSHWYCLFGPHKDLLVTRQETHPKLPTSFQMKEGFYTEPVYWMHFVLRAILTYIIFTPMHDASHDSIARANSGAMFLNYVIGWLSSINFGAPFPLFKHLHLDHHRYTNSQTYDADLWAGGNFGGVVYSPKRNPYIRFLLLPLRCATQIYHYLFHALKYYVQYLPGHVFFSYVILIVCTVVLPLLSATFFHQYNYLFYGYHFPVLGAVLILALSFDYLPHRPHEVSDNPILATSLITWRDPNIGKKKKEKLTAREIKASGIDLLTIPFLSQNLHPIHHLYPNIPFYRYSNVYWRMAETLQAAGLRAKPLFPLIVNVDGDIE